MSFIFYIKLKYYIMVKRSASSSSSSSSKTRKVTRKKKKSTDRYGLPKGTSRGRKAYGKTKAGKCRICGHVGYTEIHHIISQTRRPEFKYNKGNMIELCLSCHNNTTASLVFARLTGKMPSGAGKCYTCGKSGHWSSSCPKNKSKKKTQIRKKPNKSTIRKKR